MPTPILVKNNKITNYFTHLKKTTMVKSSVKNKIIKKKVPVKGYMKKNGSVISPHTRCLTNVLSSSFKSNSSRMILKNNYYNNDDSSIAFNIHMKDSRQLVRKKKQVKVLLPECSNDASIAKHLYIIELEKLISHN